VNLSIALILSIGVTLPPYHCSKGGEECHVPAFRFRLRFHLRMQSGRAQAGL